MRAVRWSPSSAWLVGASALVVLATGLGSAAGAPPVTAWAAVAALYDTATGDDRDGDGVDDAADGCPEHPDADQADLDGDGVGDACDPVVDVAADDPFLPHVQGLVEAAVTGGCATTASGGLRFCPTDLVTRAQMAVFLLKAAGKSGTDLPAASGVFADVPRTSPFAPWIEELARRGVTSGCSTSSDGSTRLYCPDAPVTREQMAVFLLRASLVQQVDGASELPPATGVFTDVPADSGYAPWVEELLRRQITTGCHRDPATGSLSYCPRAGVLRLHMSAFLTRNFDLPTRSEQPPSVPLEVRVLEAPPAAVGPTQRWAQRLEVTNPNAFPVRLLGVEALASSPDDGECSALLSGPDATAPAPSLTAVVDAADLPRLVPSGTATLSVEMTAGEDFPQACEGARLGLSWRVLGDHV